MLPVKAGLCIIWIPPLCIQLYSQQSDQQLYPQDKGQSVKIMDSKLTPWCRIFKWSVHCYSASQNIPAVMVNKGLSVSEIWGSYSGDSFKFTIFWDAALCRLEVHYPHFGGICCLHLSDRQNELADYTAPHPTSQYSLFITTFTKCIPVAYILKQMDPVHTITDYFHKIQSNTILLYIPRSLNKIHICS